MNNNLKDPNSLYLSYWYSGYFARYLPLERGLSKNTKESYRSTIVLMNKFMSTHLKKKMCDLLVSDLSPDTLRAFLSYIENERGCSARTRNQRLTAVSAFAEYISMEDPTLLEWRRKLTIVPLKKCQTKEVPYLEKEEIKHILNQPNIATQIGKRDHAIMLFMYNTGARASEVANLRVVDLTLPKSNTEYAVVIIHGKGNKIRRCPLWDIVCKELKPIVKDLAPDDYVFTNRYGEPLTRFGIYEMIKRYAISAIKTMPNMDKKRISPHVFRHSTASHLCEAHVDMDTIREWLGHVSVDTTTIYAQSSLQMKKEAIDKCLPSNLNKRKSKKSYKDDEELLNFLESL